VTLEDISAARERIRGIALRTPLLPFPEVSSELGAEVRLKCESLQPSGSFKVRGALNFLARLSDEELNRGVVTYSSGNHGQALALAAGMRGVRAVVVMPETAPGVKVSGARRLGAEVVFAGTTSIDRQTRAEDLVEADGLTMVPPFDHPWIIAGQGTLGVEIVEDWPDVDLVLAPIGGGGLVSGLSVAVKALRPEARVLGVEASGAPTMKAALDAGEPLSLASTDTIADGLKPLRAGDLTFQHASAYLDDVVLVEDDAILEAAALLLFRRRLVVELSGAATLGALVSKRVPVEGLKVAVVLSGGNLDPSHIPVLSERMTEL
jgi:threonine dehydratase